MFGGFGPLGFAPLADDGAAEAGGNLAVTAQQGVVHATGQNASINASRIVTATQGLAHVTGQNASINASRIVTATQGLVHVTGQNASINGSRIVTAQQGLVHVTGQDADVTLGNALAFTAAQGVVHVTGQNASINASRIVLATQGLVYVTGRNATIGSAEVATPTAAPGGKYRRRKGYPRRVVIDGRVYWVNSAEEERRLLEQYKASLDAVEDSVKAVAPPESAQVRKLRVKQKQAQRRIDESYDREAEWEALLDEEDEIILMTLH